MTDTTRTQAIPYPVGSDTLVKLPEHLKAMADRLDTLLSGHADHVATVDTHLAEIDTTTSDHAERLTALDATTAGHADRLGALDADVAQLSTDLAALETTIDTTDGRIDTLAADIETGVARIDTDLDALGARIDTLADDVQTDLADVWDDARTIVQPSRAYLTACTGGAEGQIGYESGNTAGHGIHVRDCDQWTRADRMSVAGRFPLKPAYNGTIVAIMSGGVITLSLSCNTKRKLDNFTNYVIAETTDDSLDALMQGSAGPAWVTIQGNTRTAPNALIRINNRQLILVPSVTVDPGNDGSVAINAALSYIAKSWND